MPVNIIMPGGADDLGFPLPDFLIGDSLTVFEFCLIYTEFVPTWAARMSPDRSYGGTSWRDMRDRERFLGVIHSVIRDAYGVPMGPRNDEKEQVRYELYTELAHRIRRDEIELLRTAYRDDDSHIDPTRCVIHIDTAIEIADRRGDYGRYMSALIRCRRRDQVVRQALNDFEGMLAQVSLPKPMEKPPSEPLKGAALYEALRTMVEEEFINQEKELLGRGDLLSFLRRKYPNASEDHARDLRREYATPEAKKGGAPYHRKRA